MLKLIKYLKSSVASILIIVVLLVGQAACDLTLPQYTSNIVNVGIQQGGVENAAPTVIRVSEMNKLFLFMSQAEQDTVLQSYKKLDKADMTAADADKALKKYPQLAKEPLYERTAKDDETIDALSRLLSKPMLVVMGFSGDNEEMGAMANQMLSSLPPQMAGKDVFDVLAMMTDEQRSQMITAINDKMKEMPDSILEQSAVVFVKQEYQAVGIDTDKLQNNYVLLTGAKMLGLALLSMLLTVLVGFIACYGVAEPIYGWLSEPLKAALPAGSKLIYTSPQGAFFVYLKVALVTSIFATSPFTFYQLWAFIAPGLYKEEKQAIAPLAFFSAFFFGVEEIPRYGLGTNFSSSSVLSSLTSRSRKYSSAH